jgi:hypothetical protein
MMRPMNPPKPNRRKAGSNKLEPIDWHEYANDAVLNGNMSTLFQRPPTEDPSAYASPEALVEIEKRTTRVGQALSPANGPTPTASVEPVEGASSTVGMEPEAVPGPAAGRQTTKNARLSRWIADPLWVWKRAKRSGPFGTFTMPSP